MSRETTMARAEAREAAESWRQHCHSCAICSAAAKARQWPKLCDQGTIVRDTSRLAASALEQSKQLDAQPITGQGRLL